ncbi:hypothetical protein EK21DRAFT_112621 [Setomelanomma holmii]|uniref:C2H2 type master regulator of conidiophore development brlA n=1 Tax=Setomelanomma holmii TaxID=210430 RepID=A0A9P4H9X5_9PLEO|nr:hypothetical protein EK21DRAFT_112621 [Setomelanomma holmii]
MNNNALPDVAMDLYYPDLDNMLSPLCQFCAIPFHTCIHASAPYAAARMLQYDPQLFHAPLPDPAQAVDLGPLVAFNTTAENHDLPPQQQPPQPPLMNDNVQYFDWNGTTVQPATVQAHIEDIYTPGDRQRRKTSIIGVRTSPSRRQAPRPGGYACDHEGCERRFDRACELNRHRKTHLDSTARPHQCNICHEGFLYPKDLHRHQKTHIEHRSAQMTFFCPHPGCNNAEGFSRRDNLLRHQRKQHRAIIAAA